MVWYADVSTHTKKDISKTFLTGLLFTGKYQGLSMFTCYGVLESNELVMHDKLALHELCSKTKVKQNKTVVAGRKLSLTDECFRNLGNFYKSLMFKLRDMKGLYKIFTRIDPT